MQQDASRFALISPAAWLLIFALSTALLTPFFFYHITGDVVAHYFNMSCAGKALLEGDTYPRWCRFASDGIGSPAMFFYFPLPYFISSLFYPLIPHLLNIESLYVLQLWLCNIVTMAGCLLWFRRFSSLRASLILAVFYLGFPYRAELLFFRSALAELWVLALIPYVMWQLEKLKTHPKDWTILAIFFALCLFAHIPASLVFAFAIAVLFATKYYPTNMLPSLSLALFLATLLTAIYWLPAILYQPYVMGNADLALFDTYPNRQPMLIDILHTARNRILLAGGVAFVFCALLGGRLLRFPAIIQNPTLKRATIAAMIMAGVGCLALLPLSAPLFQAIKQVPILSEIVMPWRFQLLWLIAAMLLGIVALQFPNFRPRWKVDVAMLTALMVALATFVMVAFSSALPEKYPYIFANDVLPLKEYRTVWQKIGFDTNDLMEQIRANDNEFITLAAGNAAVSNTQISKELITFDVAASTPATLTLRHLYFPSWEVKTPETVMLNPEHSRGLMQLSIPQGTHHIALKHDVYNAKIHVILPYLQTTTLVLWLVMFVYIAYTGRKRRTYAP